MGGVWLIHYSAKFCLDTRTFQKMDWYLHGASPVLIRHSKIDVYFTTVASQLARLRIAMVDQNATVADANTPPVFTMGSGTR